jgi:cytochrome c-type biogenesis protein CcmH
MLTLTTAWAEPLPPAEEARAQALFHELRCLVCQNQSIAESNAPLAEDLRVLVRERLAMGESDRAIKDYLVARYGEFVLLRPDVSLHTLLLWGTPLIAIAAGLALAARAVARRRAQRIVEPDVALDPDEQRRLDQLLTDSPHEEATVSDAALRARL